MLLLRSLLFYVGMILGILVYTVLSFFILPLPYLQRYRIMTGWGRFTIWWLEKTCRVTYQVQGLENLPKTPAIILSNHQSTWETIVYQQIFPTQTWILKKELLKLPLFGWGLATLKLIAIDRNNLRQSMKQIVEQGKQYLAQGIWIVIFPEGTRVTSGGKKSYGIGGALLAEKSGYPVIPVAHNSGQFWLSKQLIKRPGTIQVRIGPMIDSKGKDYKEINQLAQNWIEETVAKL
jgi:1-acyl-sn-glycerol-3-phosphate acyltransferase